MMDNRELFDEVAGTYKREVIKFTPEGNVMGLRDDDPSIYADRDLLDWARRAPEPRGYDDGPETEDQTAMREHARRKHAEQKPRRRRYADED